MGRYVGIGLVALLLVGGVGACTVGGSVLGSYNTLVQKDEGVDSQWGQVQNVYQRRNDLVPNLVETVRGYAIHENETFVGVTEARAKVGQVNINANNLNPAMLAQFQQSQGELSSALSRLMVVVEKYPELKANESFNRLMDEMAGTENRISVERMRFNEVAKDFNAYRNQFPTNLVANHFKFGEKPYFEAEEGAKTAPKVDFKDLRQR